MSCRETKELLPAEIGGLLEGEEWARVGAHLAACDACRAERERLTGLLARVPEALGAAPAGSWEALEGALASALTAPLVAASEAAVEETRPPVRGRWRTSRRSAEQDRPPLAAQDLPRPAFGEQEPAHKVGPFVIVSRVGIGAMGAVYLARHEQDGTEVALKLLPAGSSPRTTARMLRDGALLATRLDHPSLVRTWGAAESPDGFAWFAQEWLEGAESLEERIARCGRCGPEEAAEIVLSIAQGLAHAHEQGILHRDVTAGNILLDRSGRAKLADFGLSRRQLEEPRLTCEGAMIGTPLYMAPELGRVRELDGRTDIYSLGVVFYYLVTGVQPFRGFSALDILRAAAHDRLAPPEHHVPDLPADFRRVLGAMLAKDRNHRYADAQALIQDLEALVVGLPPTATKGSAPWSRGGPPPPSDRPFFPADPPTRSDRLWQVAAIALYAGLVVLLVALLARKYL